MDWFRSSQSGASKGIWHRSCYLPPNDDPHPMKTRLLLAALATTVSAFAIANVPEASSTFPLLAVGVVALGFLARRLRK